MNAISLAHRAYAPTGAPTRTARSIEYEVIARISFRLKEAIKKKNYPQLVAALHENQNLWMTLAIDVADDANELPDQLRARIVYLAEFTRQHTAKVINKSENAIPLLEINAAILRGLKQESTTL